MPYLNRLPPDPEPLDCRILTAALDLFVLKGYHNVSVHDVQKQADVSIGSIYKYFGGKEGIAKALYDRLLGELDEMIDIVNSDYSTARQRCDAIIRLLFEYTESHTHIIAYIFHAKHVEFISDEITIFDSSPLKKMQHIVQQGMDHHEFRKTDPCVATASIFGAAIRMIHLRLDGIISDPLPDYLNALLKSTWEGMEK